MRVEHEEQHNYGSEVAIVSVPMCVSVCIQAMTGMMVNCFLMNCWNLLPPYSLTSLSCT